MQSDERGLNLFHIAAQRGDLPLLRALISSRSKYCDEGDEEEGFTPFHFAVGYGQFAAAIMLLQAGARIETYSRYGSSPMRWAEERRDIKMIRLMRSLGAEPTSDIKNKLEVLSEETILKYRAMVYFDRSLLSILLLEIDKSS